MSFLGCLGKTKHFLSKLPVDFCRAPKLLRNMGIACVHRAERWKTGRQTDSSKTASREEGQAAQQLSTRQVPLGSAGASSPRGTPGVPCPYHPVPPVISDRTAAGTAYMN